MRAQATVEGIDHVVRNGLPGFYETGAPSAIAPPSGEVVMPGDTTTVETVRIEPVRWSVIIAGVFATFATMGLLGVLASALGLPPILPNALRIVPVATGVVLLVGVIVAILGFGVGGWVAARLSVIHTLRTGLLASALVWAVSAPIIISGMAGARLIVAEAHAAAMAQEEGPFGALDPGLGMGARAVVSERVETHGAAMFIGLAFGFGAALVGGSIGVSGRSRARR